MGLIVKSTENFNDFTEMRDSWNNLLMKCEGERLFLTHEWFTIWWKGFGDENKMFILTVMNKGDELVGLAPLMIHKEKIGFFLSKKEFYIFPLKEISFMSNAHSSRCDFIIPGKQKEVLIAIFNFLRNHNNRWDVIRLSNISEDSTNLNLLEEAALECNLKTGDRIGLKSPYLTIDKPWDQFWSSRSKNLRSQYNRIRNKIKRDFPAYKIERYTSPSEIDYSMKIAFEIDIKSWKKKADTHMSSITTEEFYRKLIKTMANCGDIDFWVLFFGENAVAYRMHLFENDLVYFLKTSYDESFFEYSPGFYLEIHILQKMFEYEMRIYDFIGTDERYKTRLASDVRTHKELFIFHNRVHSSSSYYFNFKIRPLLKKLNFYKKLNKL